MNVKVRQAQILRAAAIASIVLLALVPFFDVSSVLAKGSFLAALKERYPYIEGSAIDNCGLCHTAEKPQLNPYGMDYKMHQGDVIAIEALDSDGDGFTNVTEIMALTAPGNPESTLSMTPHEGPVTPVFVDQPVVPPPPPEDAAPPATTAPAPAPVVIQQPPNIPQQLPTPQCLEPIRIQP